MHQSDNEQAHSRHEYGVKVTPRKFENRLHRSADANYSPKMRNPDCLTNSSRLEAVHQTIKMLKRYAPQCRSVAEEAWLGKQTT